MSLSPRNVHSNYYNNNGHHGGNNGSSTGNHYSSLNNNSSSSPITRNLFRLFAIVCVCMFWVVAYMKIFSGHESARSNGLQSPADVLLEQAEKATGIKKEYPTYELEAAGGAGSITKEEAEEIANEVEELEKVIEKEDEEREAKIALEHEASNDDINNNGNVVDVDAEDDEQASATATSDVIKQQQQQEEEDNTVHKFFLDAEQYDSAPLIKVPKTKFMKQGIWWALKPYEKYYALHPTKWHVPRINPKVKLTQEEFHNKFRKHGLPVLFSFENLRHLGFTTKSRTFEELTKMFPYDPESPEAKKALLEYKANGVRTDEEEIDLGPGIASIMRDETLSKMGTLRNYPRNLKVTPSAIQKLGIQYPPLLPPPEPGHTVESQWQLPTVWMGTSTSDTRFHHDCCDNFVMMITGTKRFTLAPPTDWRTLSPACVGTNKSLCWAKVPHPNAKDLSPKSKEIMSKVHKIVVDVGPGEILYMPAGWFHHVSYFC